MLNDVGWQQSRCEDAIRDGLVGAASRRLTYTQQAAEALSAAAMGWDEGCMMNRTLIHVPAVVLANRQAKAKHTDARKRMWAQWWILQDLPTGTKGTQHQSDGKVVASKTLHYTFPKGVRHEKSGHQDFSERIWLQPSLDFPPQASHDRRRSWTPQLDGLFVQRRTASESTLQRGLSSSRRRDLRPMALKWVTFGMLMIRSRSVDYEDTCGGSNRRLFRHVSTSCVCCGVSRLTVAVSRVVI